MTNLKKKLDIKVFACKIRDYTVYSTHKLKTKYNAACLMQSTGPVFLSWNLGVKKMYLNKTKLPLINEIATDGILEQAYQWICKSSNNVGHNNSVWDLRFNWEKIKEQLKNALLNNTYQLSPLRRYSIAEQTIDCWDAQDAVVLKAIAIVVAQVLEIDMPSCCTHIKGHGGSKKTVSEIQDKLKNYKFVYKSDVQSYYKSIDHKILLKQLKEKISDKVVLRLIYEYCNRLVWIDGEYDLINRGIALGCPLSPLFGAWFLREMDLALRKQNVYYVRFMDDWVMLAKTLNHLEPVPKLYYAGHKTLIFCVRCSHIYKVCCAAVLENKCFLSQPSEFMKRFLRKAIKTSEKILTSLKLKKHPDKTFIGWIKKGFDFLGYRVTLTGIQLSAKTKQRCVAKIVQLYEQGASRSRIGKYWQNWVKWARSGIKKNRFISGFVELNKILQDLNQLNDATELACNNRLITRRNFYETQNWFNSVASFTHRDMHRLCHR